MVLQRVAPENMQHAMMELPYVYRIIYTSEGKMHCPAIALQVVRAQVVATDAARLFCTVVMTAICSQDLDPDPKAGR